MARPKKVALASVRRVAVTPMLRTLSVEERTFEKILETLAVFRAELEEQLDPDTMTALGIQQRVMRGEADLLRRVVATRHADGMAKFRELAQGAKIKTQDFSSSTYSK